MPEAVSSVWVLPSPAVDSDLKILTRTTSCKVDGFVEDARLLTIESNRENMRLLKALLSVRI